jgi:hypothetical protein
MDERVLIPAKCIVCLECFEEECVRPPCGCVEATFCHACFLQYR